MQNPEGWPGALADATVMLVLHPTPIVVDWFDARAQADYVLPGDKALVCASMLTQQRRRR